MNNPPVVDLQATFDRIDIYLFDQLLRGRILPEHTVLDPGCGSGRNLVFLSRMGCSLTAVDQDPAAVEAASKRVQLASPENRVIPHVGPLDDLPFGDAHFDVVLCSAVLHFARSREHFLAMARELWRVLKPGGIWFSRLATFNGIEDSLTPVGDGSYRLADGRVWYLSDRTELPSLTEILGGKLLDPIKTTNVAEQRCMTTWVAEKLPA